MIKSDKKIGLKQTISSQDISIAPYFLCKKSIKKSCVHIKPLYGYSKIFYFKFKVN
jgi:hypothetical protein